MFNNKKIGGFMFISPVNSLNCKKPRKISFCVNPENVEKAVQKATDEIPVKKAKTWLGKWWDELFTTESDDISNQIGHPVHPFNMDNIHY